MLMVISVLANGWDVRSDRELPIISPKHGKDRDNGEGLDCSLMKLYVVKNPGTKDPGCG